eukprot:GEMP01026618.1.p1 GENE.GEMP01026618.1~~GEMP01026618.1.p1  ORF type:complete len:308 (+),score=66.58 GEMP01026618.1:109-1032(+)
MSHALSPVCRDGNLIAWAADRYLFVYDVAEKKFTVERNDAHEAAIRSISCRNGKWATGGDDKKVTSWSSSWEPTTFTAQKKVTAVLQLDDRILFADRYGDVYSWQNGNPTLLLGHLASITQMILVSNDTFIITADNNDKIRVSKYPEAYVIHSFCLGHTQHVSKLLPLTDGFASLSADRTLRVWSLDGTEKKCVPLMEDATPCDGVIEGDHCIALYQNREKMHKINLQTGAIDAEPLLPTKAQAILTETIYISTTGHLESTTEKFSVFSGEDVETPVVHFGAEKEDDEEPREEHVKHKRRKKQHEGA